MAGEVVLLQGGGCQGGFGIEEAGQLGDEGVTLYHPSVSIRLLQPFGILSCCCYALVLGCLSTAIPLVAPLLSGLVVALPWKHIAHKRGKAVQSVDRETNHQHMSSPSIYQPRLPPWRDPGEIQYLCFKRTSLLPELGPSGPCRSCHDSHDRISRRAHTHLRIETDSQSSSRIDKRKSITHLQ